MDCKFRHLRMCLRAGAIGAALVGLCAAPPNARAQVDETASGIDVELNKMESHGENGCRLAFVFRNGTDQQFETLKLDLVMFNHDDVIARRLIVDASPLRPGKTTVKLFDIDEPPCSEIATVLVNDVPACVSAGETRADCVELVNVSSRASAALTK